MWGGGGEGSVGRERREECGEGEKMKEKKGKDGGEGGVRNVNNEEYTRTCTVHNFIVDNCNFLLSTLCMRTASCDIM